MHNVRHSAVWCIDIGMSKIGMGCEKSQRIICGGEATYRGYNEIVYEFSQFPLCFFPIIVGAVSTRLLSISSFDQRMGRIRRNPAHCSNVGLGILQNMECGKQLVKGGNHC